MSLNSSLSTTGAAGTVSPALLPAFLFLLPIHETVSRCFLFNAYKMIFKGQIKQKWQMLEKFNETLLLTK
jgi:hypothetical protein